MLNQISTQFKKKKIITFNIQECSTALSIIILNILYYALIIIFVINMLHNNFF